MNNLKRPIKYLARKKYIFAFGIFAVLLVDILQLLVPGIVKDILNDLMVLDSSKLLYRSAIIFLIALGIGILRFCWRMMIVVTSFYIEEQLRNELYDHYLTLDRSFYDKTNSGHLIALATNDLQAVRMMFSMGVIGTCDGIFLTVISIIFMLSMDVKLTLFVLLPLPVITGFILLLGKQIFSRFTAVQESFSRLTARVQEYLKGPRLIKNFMLYQYSTDDVNSFSGDLLNQNIRLVKVWGVLFPLMLFITGLASALVVLLGGQSVIFRNLTIGEFVAFTSYIGILAWPMMAIGWVMNIFQRGKASLERINVMLDTEPGIAGGDDPVIPSQDPVILLDSVSFRFPGTDRDVLKNISLSIKKGEKIGITGPTGSGKTTLVNILTRQYDPVAGSLFLYGKEYSSISLQSLREVIALVPQHTVLFSEPVSENITFSDDSIDEGRIHRAADMAQLKSTIELLPEGYNTILGERGVNLSGGQKQRLSIARALLQEKDLVIFDDSFSAVDTETEKMILKNLDSLACGAVIISHRVSTISGCDRIFVMDMGRIVESGTHDELLRHGGLYAGLNRKQQLEEEVEDGK